jgi:hypothetical protein
MKQKESKFVVQLLLEIVLENTDADSWKYFFGYTPELNELVQLDSSCLFDPSNMDEMNPPLSYQQVGEIPQG